MLRLCSSYIYISPMLHHKESPEKIDFNNLAYIYPPDVERSQRHRLANRIFRKIDFRKQVVEVCQCCGRCVGQESDTGTLSYDPLIELSYSGPGLPLLFVFSKNVMLSEVLLITIVSILAIILNALNNSCIDGDCSQQNFFTKLSLANDANNFQLIVAMALVFTLIWAVFNHFLIYRCRVTEVKADEDRVTPSDFAIFLLDLPEGTTQRDIEEMLDRKRKVIKARLKLLDLSEYEKKILTEANDFKVQMILFPYKTAEYIQSEKQQEEEYMRCIREGREEQFCKEVSKKPEDLSNSAIIIFEKEITKSMFVKNHSFHKEFKQFFCNKGSEPNQIAIRGEKISVLRASEPDDIIWENLQVSIKSIVLNKITTNLFGFLVLLIGGLIQYWLAVWQIKNPDSTSNSIILIFSAILVTFSNYLLSLLLIWATKKEGNFTKSKYNASLTLKICLFQFFNSGLFYTFSNLMAIQLTDNSVSHSMQEMFSNKITVCMIVDAVTEGVKMLFIGYFEFPNSIFRILMEKGIVPCSQKRCNEIYQLNDCDIPEKYAYLIKILWLTCFYTPFVPLVSFISLVGLFFFYFAMKISFRHFYKISSVRSNETNMRALRLSYFAPFMLSLGLLVINLFYEGYRSGEFFHPDHTSKVIIIFSLSLSGLYGIIPWYHINEALSSLKNLSNCNYRDAKNTFETTYDDKLFTVYRDKYTSPKNENYFLLNMAKRESRKDNIDFQPFFNKFIQTASTTAGSGGQGVFTCRRLFSDPVGSHRS